MRSLRKIRWPAALRSGEPASVRRDDSVATFDNLAAVPKSVLTTCLGALGTDGRRRICEALDAMANC